MIDETMINFDENQKGKTEEQRLDEFYRYAFLHPQEVYEMSKRIPMGMNEYIKKSSEHGEWLTPQNNSCIKSLDCATKIKIAIGCIAVAIIITHIVCAVC